MPTTVNSGELLITVMGVNGNTVLTPAAGWTLSFNVLGPGSAVRGMVVTKVADGTEGGTTVTHTTSTSERSSHCTYAITDWEGTLSGVEFSTGATGTSTGPDPDSLSPSWGSDDTLWIAAYGGRQGTTISSYPTNYTANQLSAQGNTGVGGSGAGSATRELAAASEDPGAFTLAASIAWVAMTIGVQPAAATGFNAWYAQGSNAIQGGGNPR